jgi:uncharacterized protein (DUF58 family)
VTAGAALPPRLLERLGGLEFVARRVVEGYVAGLHRSPYRGAGEEFARHRAYQQGDEVRRIDWRLYGRTDRLYVREFREDSNLQAYIVVDASLSMEYADGEGVGKLQYARWLAAALAHLMLRGGDAVGLASVAAAPVLHVPPRNRAGQLHDIIVALDRLRPAGAGTMPAALDRVGGALRRRGRVVVIGDLLGLDDGTALVRAVSRLRARGDEVAVLRVATPLEAGDGPLPAGRFFDPEHPAVEAPGAPAATAEYRRSVTAYYDGLRDALRRAGAEYVPLTTAVPVEHALSAWLTER